MPIRRVVLDYEVGMGVFWNTQPEGLRRRTDHAVDRFHELRLECENIPKELTRLVPLHPRKVRYLPFEETISAEIADVLLYGNYGEMAKIVCWNSAGIKLPDELSQSFMPPGDVNNLEIIADLVFIGTSLEKVYCRPSKRST